MNALREMYGLRRTSLAVSSILLSASTVHLMNLPSQGAAVQLTQAMRKFAPEPVRRRDANPPLEDLDKMSVNHRYASCCLEAINRLANQWGIRLPEATANLAPFPSPKPDQAMPNMSLFFTQATLSNESPESHVTPPAQSLRHDSCSIFEPSLAAHNMPILPTNSQSSLGVASQHSMHSTPVNTTLVQAQMNMWSSFPSQQMSTPMQLQSPTADFDVINVDSSASFGY